MGSRFDELKSTGRLPSPPGVAMTILRLTQQEDYSVADIARAIQSDPALSGRVLKLVNASKNAGVRPIASIEEATKRLGVRTLRGVALGFSLISAYRDGACKGFGYSNFWSESLGRAVAAQAVAQTLGHAFPSEAYSCGLLADVGRLALASVHPDRYGAILAAAGGDPQALRRGEVEAFEIDHVEVTATLLADWGLSKDHIAAITRFLSDEDCTASDGESVRQIAGTLFLAQPTAQIFVHKEKADLSLWNRRDKARARLGIESRVLDQLSDQVAGDWEEWGKILDLPTAAVPSFAELRAAVGRKDEKTATIELPGVERLRVLAVDDERLSLRLLVHHLEATGHSVIQASNGKEALSLALEKAPEVIVSDWKMPEMDGIDLVQALRRYEAGRNMYVIMLTGSGDEDKVVEAFEAGIDDYVTKPFNPRVLLARVRAGERVIRLQSQVVEDRKKLKVQMAKLAVLNRRLEKASVTDLLTGLKNRRYAIERLREAWASAIRTTGPLAVIMIDIDHFKSVNDRFGHAAGDLVLRETAKVFTAQVREEESICRMGGEEFLVICPSGDLEDAAVAAERIRKAVEKNRIVGEGFDGNVTVSLGVAMIQAHHVSYEDLLKSADRAVYEAKHAGRNQVRLQDDAGQPCGSPS